MKKSLFNEAKLEGKWETIKTSDFYKPMLENVKKSADVYIEKPITALKYSDFKQYYTTGSRKEYEHEYFDRRGRLNTLSLMALISDDEKYSEALEDIIWAICEEFSWALPAHLEDSLPMSSYRVWIDLFAAETGFALSEILFLLKHKLSDKIKKRIEFEVRERIIESYLYSKVDFWWENCTNNWAAVCGGSVGAAFMYMASEDEFLQVKDRLLTVMDNFLSRYEDDGVCTEGYSYLLYGFGYFTYFAELLKQYTGGEINLFAIPKIQSIAEFQQKVILCGNKSISFSDGSSLYKHRLGLSHFWYKNFEGIEVPPLEYMAYFSDDHCFRWATFIRDFIWSDDTVKNGTIGEGQYYMANSGWYIKRSSCYSFAAKAGHNEEPHNHNDVGSFILNIGVEGVLCDLGAGEYTADYFSNKRYDYLCNCSRGHSVPVINGNYQKAGRQYSGNVVKADENEFEIEFSKAYDIKGLKELKRNFKLEKDGILIQDSFVFDEKPSSITERLISLTKPVVEGNKITVGSGSVEFDESILTCSVIEEEYSDHHAVATKVYIIELSFKAPDKNCSALIKISI